MPEPTPAQAMTLDRLEDQHRIAGDDHEATTTFEDDGTMVIEMEVGDVTYTQRVDQEGDIIGDHGTP